MNRKEFKQATMGLLGSMKLLGRQCIGVECLLVDTSLGSEVGIDSEELQENIAALREVADGAEASVQSARMTADLLESHLKGD